MSAETDKATLRRVQDGLFHLQKGLTSFVTALMRKQHGERWLHYASRAAGGSPNAPLDAYGLIKTMIDNWPQIFDAAFARPDKHRARAFASTALEARNATAHLAVPLADEEALRYLDAMHQLLRLVKAPAEEVAELKRLYDTQRHSGTAPAPAAPAPPVPAATLDLPPAEASAKALKPWTEWALPHPDVLQNRFKEAEFAADLFAVDAGYVTDDYATPESFFRITFLTEGLKRVLTSSLQRLAGAGDGDPVIGLQTAFGGGKTHTMLAIYHLAKAPDLSRLAGMSELVGKLGLDGWKRPQVAVFVGSSKGTDVSLNLQNGPRVHTLWGYIAWRLAGEAGLKLVAEAEAARTNPGSELMVEVLRLAGPSVILLDELVAFARQLPDDRFEAFLSFIQSLTEAVKIVPNALLVGSLPEARAEAGGEKGVAALLRLEKVLGRMQSPWLPAAGDETYEIIRRRLFQPLDADGERGCDETVRAFHEMYRKNPAEFPPETREQRYLDLLRLSYPIHPELFDRLVARLGRTGKIPAHPRRAALHGERGGRAVAGADPRPADHAGPHPGGARAGAGERAVSARPRLRRGGGQGGGRRRLSAGAHGSEPVPPHLADARGDTGGARRVPVLGAVGGPAELRPDRARPAAGLRRTGRPARDLRRGAARADRAGDLSVRGSGTVLVLDPCDAEPRGRGSGEGMARARGGRSDRRGAAHRCADQGRLPCGVRRPRRPGVD